MCIIVYKPAGRRLFDKTIENCFANNSDGAGFTYVEAGELHTHRGFFKIGDLMDAYKPHELKQALLHFRIKTHGDLSEQNCHPHKVTPKMVFAHNGVIYRMPSHKEKSDTLLFNELLLQNLVRIYGKRIVFEKHMRVLIQDFIGTSKLVFLTNTGQVSIFNEKDGVWDSNCWFSNDSYSREPYKATYTVYPPYVTPKLTKEEKKIQRTWNRQRAKWDSANAMGDQTTLPMNASLPDIVRPLPFSPLKVTDFVRLLYMFQNVPELSIGKVMGIYGNSTIECYFPLLRYTKRVPLMYLEKINVPNSPILLPETTTERYED